ncbi:GMC oxidoreductase [Tuber magnatum]|uniref:GMC oxidoreductase n=1 Tax=Tuber magnatum TaxID=42249 RepID=A0A317SRT9_9PEZI|nr:GMC oxidoreductase [Tuber magnatum]
MLGTLIGEQEQLLDSYTYVIVGGGTAGLTVANRLSEDPDTTVLVLEAGIPDRKECAAILQRCLGGTMRSVYDWNITTEPQIYLSGRRQNLPIGKALGGSSMLNGMMFDRGAPSDYDMWEDLGNPGWGWAGLLPYFKKSETFTPPKPEHVARFGITYDPSVHGFDGYVQSGYPNFIYPQNKNFQDAMKSLGIAQPLDQAGEALGAFWSPNTIDPKNMTRSYARSAYFDNFVGRQNLHVYTSRHVTKLITEDNDEESGEGMEISGVEYVKPGDATRYVAKAKKEVIISAGTVHTPQILQLSGIGRKSLLEKLSIPVLIDLPGVGQNFQDHPYIMLIQSNQPVDNVEHSVIDLDRNASWDAESKALFYSNREGPWTAGSPNSVAFLPLSTYTDKAEALLGAYTTQEPGQHLRDGSEPAVIAGFQKHRQILLNRLAGTHTAAMEFIWLSGANQRFQMPFSISVTHPFSRGFIEINSTDPLAAPIVDLRTGSNPVDLNLFVEAFRFNRRLVQTPAIQELVPTELTPGPLLREDEELGQFARANLSTMFHPSGTSAMQPREIGGVVDHNLMVYGTRNLRVVDASIMPLIPGSHLVSTVYAIGEKAADIIKAAGKN